MRRGVILAGGEGKRLQPLTSVANKHLLPVYDKPMIFYPLETLKALGIRDILIVSGGEHIGTFAEFLGDGSGHGVNLTYKVQKQAGGIAHALGLAEDFFRSEKNITVILGDNIFENEKIKLPDNYKEETALLFGKEIADPGRFGVATLAADNSIVAIEEKPEVPKSKIAITGLYIYPADVFDIIKILKPSTRGELEITDVNNHYINQNRCQFCVFSGFWSDAGTFDSLSRSSLWAKEKSL